MKKCVDCVERHVGCHSECEYYLREKEKLNKRREQINKQKAIEYDRETYLAEKNYKRMKRR